MSVLFGTYLPHVSIHQHFNTPIYKSAFSSFKHPQNFQKTYSVICGLTALLATLQICEKTTPPPNFKPQTDDLLMLQNCTNLILSGVEIGTWYLQKDNKISLYSHFSNHTFVVQLKTNTSLLALFTPKILFTIVLQVNSTDYIFSTKKNLSSSS